MPRLSSPLNAKASVRSPYALDRSQQNSCVGTVCPPAVRKASETPTHALCALMSSQVGPASFRGSRTNPSIHNVIRQPGQARSETCHPRSLIASWWSQTGSNRRPHACKARALPTELWPLLKPAPLGTRRLVLSPKDHTAKCGGPRQTRTADLTLIRRVL